MCSHCSVLMMLYVIVFTGYSCLFVCCSGDGGDLGEGGGLASSGEGLEGMSVVVAQLQQQLRQTSHTHQLQLQESKVRGG